MIRPLLCLRLLLFSISAALLFTPQLCAAEPVKNIIVLVADGMGPQQAGLALSYAHQAPSTKLNSDRTLNIERIAAESVLGLMLTPPEGSLVVDSACSTTQFTSGRTCRPEMLGVDDDNRAVPALAEHALRGGKAVGLVSDTRITHATPAAFAAHVVHRKMENEIAGQLLKSGIDVMLSGGLRHFLPQSVNRKGSKAYRDAHLLTGGRLPLNSKRQDERNLLAEAQNSGYELCFDRACLAAAAPRRILGLFAPSFLPDAITANCMRGAPDRSIPSLLEMTGKALELLENRPQGFLFLVEAGQIDFAGHQNDAGLLLHELLKFDEIAGFLYDWARNRSDTLFVVLADHETGGFSMSYSAVDIPNPEQIAAGTFAGSFYAPQYNFGRPQMLDKLFLQKKSFAGIFSEFESAPAARRTPAELVRLIEKNTAFQITRKEAARILTLEKNKYHKPGHEELNAKLTPKMDTGGAFYPYVEDRRTALLARALSEQTNIVWSTGTHTASPVLVFAYGPHSWASRFAGIYPALRVGTILQEAAAGVPAN